MPPKKLLLKNRFNRSKTPTEKKRGTTNTLLDRIEECDRHGQFDLDISKLSLNTWPLELVLLARVRTIKANNNNLTTVPNISPTFKNLEILTLSHNKIEHLNDIYFAGFTFLKTLDLSYNNMKLLPTEIVKLTFLQTLIVKNNKLTDFPDNMKDLKSLKSLDASHNCLTIIGNKLDSVASLEDLNLTNNPGLKIDVLNMGTRTKRLFELRVIRSSKQERRALITRALNIYKSALIREQNIVFKGMASNNPEFP